MRAAAAAAAVVALVAVPRSAPVATAGAGSLAGVSVAKALPEGQILFTRTPRFGERTDLYAIDSDGSQPRLFLRNADQAAVSRSGVWVAFVRSGAIWVMRRDGSRQRAVTSPHPVSPAAPGHHSFTDMSPAWSPDGGTLYFSRLSWQTTSASIYAVGFKGGAAKRLTDAPADTGWSGEGTCHDAPSVSPDGKTIVFTVVKSCIHGFDSSLAAITRQGASTRLPFPLATPPAASYPQYGDAEWAPRGRRIAYEVSKDDWTFTGIYVSNMRGAPQRLSTTSDPETRAWVAGPTWSPDAKWLAFSRARDGVSHIWRASSDGRTTKQLTRTPAANDTDPAWLPARVLS